MREGRVPDPAALLADAPEALRAIAVRAMKVDRDERFPTARDVVHALSHYLHGLDAPADAGALEHFLVGVMPPKHASVPPPSGRPPPMPSLAGAPRRHGARQGPHARRSRARAEPRHAPRDAHAERAGAARAAGRHRRRAARARARRGGRGPPHAADDAAASRALVHMIGELAFKADATLEWTRDDGFVLVLGVLRPHVDDALRAARLALEILDAARSIAVDADDEPRRGHPA